VVLPAPFGPRKPKISPAPIAVQRLGLTGRTERIQLELGQPGGKVPIEIVGGARTIRIERPKMAPIRLQVAGGTGRVEVDGQVLGRRGGEWTVESASWTGRGDRYRVAMVGGSKSIEIVGR
jgi:hypothetical protein